MAKSTQEVLQRSGPANLQNGIESVGGILSLSSSKLRFTPHAVNVNRATVEIDLDAIVQVKPARTLFLGIIPLLDNAFIASLANGSELRFTVRKRDQWIDAIGEFVANGHDA